MTAPLPPINEDPAIMASFETKANYRSQLDAIRADPNISDGYKAEKIAALYEQTSARIGELSADFDGRRRARWDELHKLVPSGPDIAEDATPADRTVLLAAWTNTIERARAAHPEELAKAYADARRWGDDLTARAIFVVAQSEGRSGEVVRQFTVEHPEVAAALDEIAELRMPRGRGWIDQAFGRGPVGLFDEPPEVRRHAELQRLGAR